LRVADEDVAHEHTSARTYIANFDYNFSSDFVQKTIDGKRTIIKTPRQTDLHQWRKMPGLKTIRWLPHTLPN
jgi:hypothetical protein